MDEELSACAGRIVVHQLVILHGRYFHEDVNAVQ